MADKISIKKEDKHAEWYVQVITKSNLISYTNVSGCYILKPRAYAIWENIKKHLSLEFKKRNVQEAYFPLLIPENLLTKEKEHVEGFNPEVAWVTESGNSKLSERLAIRPTSETIIYDSYSKWISSYNDLPLKMNQWCNIVRWEFNNPIPFIRSREFLWQEGHTVFSTKKDAEEEVYDILSTYKKLFEEVLAIPVFEGRKSEREKFAGAEFTLSIETFLPVGKGIQSATSHHLGTNFSKAFNIRFKDKDEENKFAWQNSWGLSTRAIGVMIMMHSDNKGLVMPPKIAWPQIAIVPIITNETKDDILNECEKIKDSLIEYVVEIDSRDQYTPGWKFNYWEMQGVPLRIEIGPRDVERGEVILVRRDNKEKKIIKKEDLNIEVANILDKIQQNLFIKAKNFIESNKIKVNSFEEFINEIKNKKIIEAFWCGEPSCEEDIKFRSKGAKSLNIPFKQEASLEKCIFCDEKAKYKALFAKSY